MLVVLSPAKNLDYESPLPAALNGIDFEAPLLLPQTKKLLAVLKTKSTADLCALMDISKTLGKLNQERYQNFRFPFTTENARPALCAFNGDVYRGIDSAEYSKSEFTFAQQTVRILSGLYGLLRPLDLMQPYRLEMGSKLGVGKTKDLYGFWGNAITDLLNEQLAAGKHKQLINLASQEYFKSVKPERLIVPVISPSFQEKRGAAYRVVSINAKKARGIMTNFIVRQRIKTPKALLEFREAGYRYHKELSTPAEPVFTRD